MPAPQATLTTRSPSWELLALLRFFLAAIVVCNHVPEYSSAPVGWARMFNVFGGKAAVVGFLLVSGYSIAASLSRGERGFYRRRFLRIYPLYFFAILFAAGLELLSGGHARVPGNSFDTLGWRTVVGNFVMLQTFLVKPIPFDGPVWSLSVEVFYYLLAPIFFRMRRGWLLGLVLFSAICHVLPHRDGSGLVYFVLSRLNALRFLWCWLLGFLLWRDRGWGMGILALACAPLMLSWMTRAPLCLATYLVSVGAILVSMRVQIPNRFGRVLNYLGDLSYPLYLFHVPSLIFAYVWLGERRPLALVAFALMVSASAYEVVDKHLKRGVLAPLVLGSRGEKRSALTVMGASPPAPQ